VRLEVDSGKNLVQGGNKLSFLIGGCSSRKGWLRGHGSDESDNQQQSEDRIPRSVNTGFGLMICVESAIHGCSPVGRYVRILEVVAKSLLLRAIIKPMQCRSIGEM